MSTTIQVSEQTARCLRDIRPFGTYEQAIRDLIGERDMQSRSQTFIFSKAIAALQEDSLDHRVPISGILTSVVMDFPSGVEFLMYVRLVLMKGNSREFIVPSDDDYIRLDDANPHFPINHPVEAGDRLRVEWQNYDGGNPHTVPVVITIMPRPGG